MFLDFNQVNNNIFLSIKNYLLIIIFDETVIESKYFVDG